MNPTEPFPLANATDVAILMHRDVHFGGDFPTMIDYYQTEGKGCSEEFTLEQIEQLANTESLLGQNLAPLTLSGADAEKVARAKKAYQELRDLYEVKKPETTIPLLIADLILSEEEEPVAEIGALVAEKRASIPALIDLIRSEDFHDPLFPGYGRGPEYAARCLGKIGDKSAVAVLFETIHENEFFEEDTSLQALKWLGKPARDFLLGVVKSLPITLDNERAAIALIQFENDPEIAKVCFEMLQKINLKDHLPLATYLVLSCTGLEEPEQRKAFVTLAEQATTPSMLKQDMKIISKSWAKERT